MSIKAVQFLLFYACSCLLSQAKPIIPQPRSFPAFGINNTTKVRDIPEKISIFSSFHKTDFLFSHSLFQERGELCLHSDNINKLFINLSYARPHQPSFRRRVRNSGWKLSNQFVCKLSNLKSNSDPFQKKRLLIMGIFIFQKFPVFTMNKTENHKINIKFKNLMSF